MGSFANGYPQGGGMNQGRSPIADALSQRVLQSRLNGQQPIQAGSPSQDPALNNSDSGSVPLAPPNIGGGGAFSSFGPGSPASSASQRNLPTSNAATLAGLNLPPQPGQGGPPPPPASGAPPTSKLNTPVATTQDGTGNSAATRTANPAASSSAVPASFQPPVTRTASGGAGEIPNPLGNKATDTPAIPGAPGNPLNRSRGNVLAGLNRF